MVEFFVRVLLVLAIDREFVAWKFGYHRALIGISADGSETELFPIDSQPGFLRRWESESRFRPFRKESDPSCRFLRIVNVRLMELYGVKDA